MRTLLHVFSTFGVGGPQTRFAQLANHFGSRYRHLIVAMDGKTEALAKLNAGLDVSLPAVPNQRGKLFANIGTFRKALRELRPNLLVTSNWGTIEWAIANFDGRVPHLHMEDGFGPEEANTQIARRVWMRRLALRRSTVLVPSQRLLGIARDIWRLPRQGLIYVPNGINCGRFGAGRDPQHLAAFGLDPALPIVGTITGLRMEKNIARLIDAFAQTLKEMPAQLVIVGDGQERGRLAAQASALGIANRVVFAGPSAAPEKFLSAFNLFALSSDTEQMPLSVLEAMAAALPIAATDVGDVRYMVAEENHPFLVPTDAHRLAQKIVTLLKDPVRAAEIGRANARRVAALFNQERMFETYRCLFDGEPLAIEGLGRVNPVCAPN